MNKKKKIKKLKKQIKGLVYEINSQKDSAQTLVKNIWEKRKDIETLLRMMPHRVKGMEMFGKIFALNEMLDVTVKQVRVGKEAYFFLSDEGVIDDKGLLWGVPVKQVCTLKNMEVDIVSQDYVAEEDIRRYHKILKSV